MSEINFSWKDVPSGWALCFNQSCPLHEHCLRYQAGVLAPPIWPSPGVWHHGYWRGSDVRYMPRWNRWKWHVVSLRFIRTCWSETIRRFGNSWPVCSLANGIITSTKGVNGPCLQSNRVTSDNCSGHSAIRTAYISTVTKRPYTSLGYS